jgi:hypothetical protein
LSELSSSLVRPTSTDMKLRAHIVIASANLDLSWSKDAGLDMWRLCPDSCPCLQATRRIAFPNARDVRLNAEHSVSASGLGVRQSLCVVNNASVRSAPSVLLISALVSLDKYVSYPALGYRGSPCLHQFHPGSQLRCVRPAHRLCVVLQSLPARLPGLSASVHS